MKFNHFLIAAALLIATSEHLQAGYIASAVYNGNTYYLLDSDGIKWWDEAEAEAVSLGGHLVTINDAAEDAFVFNTFAPLAVAYHATYYPHLIDRISLFIGYSDTASEGNFVWVSGETPGYTNWIPGEPIVGDTRQQYAGIAANWYVPGQWHDIYNFPGSDFVLGVVEVNGLVAAVPEATSVMMWGLGLIGVVWARRRPLIP